MAVELVAIGASWGGLHAVESVLGCLPADFGAAIVIAQHRQESGGGDEDRLTRLLDARCALAVREAEDKQALAPGTVLVAPADYHLLVEAGTVALSVDPPLNFSRPSIDILFANEDEALALTGASDFDSAITAIAARVPTAVVTRSVNGAVAVRSGERASVPAEPIERLVDTTGAGDLFAAGFLAGEARGLGLEASLRLGAIAAAEVIQHYGARPESNLQALAGALLHA